MSTARKRVGIPLLALLGDDSPEARRRFEEGLRSVLDNDPGRNDGVARHGTPLTPEQRAEIERYLANPIAAAAHDMAGLLEDRAASHIGRPRTTPLAEALKGMRAQHPRESAKRLRSRLGDLVPESMTVHSWAKYVSRVAPPPLLRNRRQR